jgi:hypothetical protein
MKPIHIGSTQLKIGPTKDVKNEGCSGDVYENKRPSVEIAQSFSASVTGAENAGFSGADIAPSLPPKSAIWLKAATNRLNLGRVRLKRLFAFRLTASPTY